MDYARALRQQDGQALTDDVDGGEIFQLAADLVVVALAGLLLPAQVLVQLLLLREGDAVDALQHLAVGIAAPVSAAALRQLEGVGLDAAGGVEVRAGAQVGKFALRIERDDGVGGQVVDQLDLVRLALGLHVGDGLLAGLFRALQVQALLADLLHLGLDGVQMLLREGEVGIEVVVEAVVDRRADGELDLRIQALDRLRHDVRAGVPVGLAVGFVFKGVQIFFGHGCFLLVLLRGNKKSPPKYFRGEKNPTVPPCLQRKNALPLVRAVTGAPVPSYAGKRPSDRRLGSGYAADGHRSFHQPLPLCLPEKPPFFFVTASLLPPI